MTEALLKTGQHTITAITRIDSQSTLPAGVIARKVDYEKPETLVDALRGQDVLVITVSGRSPIQSIEEKLVRAAAEAEVPWILPNEWSPDSTNEALVIDVFLFAMKGMCNISEHLPPSQDSADTFVLLSCNSEAHRGTRQELLRCNGYWVLVRMEPRYREELWLRFRQADRKVLR